MRPKFTPQQLLELNRRFYDHYFQEFSATRQTFSPGWQKFIYPPAPRILDLGAGNLRFKNYLDREQISYQAYLGVDASLPLLEQSGQEPEFYQAFDLLAAIAAGQDWLKSFRSFKPNFLLMANFLHHVPTAKWRSQLLTDCSELLPVGGLLAFSLWQLAEEPNWRRRLIEDLGENDYLLSWDRKRQIPRYCHHFSPEEVATISAQLSSPTLKLLARYSADGRSGHANCWLVWQKNKRIML